MAALLRKRGYLRRVHRGRDGIGARVCIGPQHQFRYSSAGYISSSLVALHFGGVAPGSQIEVRWPSGTVQRIPITKRNAVQFVTEPDEAAGQAEAP